MLFRFDNGHSQVIDGRWSNVLEVEIIEKMEVYEFNPIRMTLDVLNRYFDLITGTQT